MAGRKRDPALDEAIVDGASALLAESGYGGFAIELVAERLRIPKSTVYKRWPSRAHLIAHVLAERVALMGDVDSHRTDALRSALIAAVRDEIAFSRTREGLAMAQALLAARDADSAGSDELLAATERRRNGYRALLERACEERLLPEDADTELILGLLLGAVWGAVLLASPQEEDDAERLVDAVLAAIPRRPG